MWVHRVMVSTQWNSVWSTYSRVSFCIEPVWVKSICNDQCLGYSGKKPRFGLLLDFFPNSPCQHLPISCSTKVVAWFAGYFAALGVQAALLARCCSQYLYFRTLQKFRWDLVVIGECITWIGEMWILPCFLFQADSNIWDIVSTHSGHWGLKEDPESLDRFQRGPWVVGLMEGNSLNSHLFSWRFSFVCCRLHQKLRILGTLCRHCRICRMFDFQKFDFDDPSTANNGPKTQEIDRMTGPAACENISTGRNSGSKSIGPWHLGTEFFLASNGSLHGQ